jgi:hypothetical protein
MKTIRHTVTFLAIILLSAPLIYAQDLSKYRNFSLGMSLAQVSKVIGANSSGTSLIHERPAVIQEITSWSMSSSLRSSDQSDPAPEMLFGFYNGELYRIEVTYDQRATAGLTDEDMVRAVSALYGSATQPATETNSSMKTSKGLKEKVIARWEDSQNLFRTRRAFKTCGRRSRGRHHRIREVGQGSGASNGSGPTKKEADILWGFSGNG